MPYEIDFLPVGTGKSGDAIAARWGTEGNYKVIVIDGGTKESGQALVEHIKKYYKTEHVNYVVNTHPDNDHASGLTEILNCLTVDELWIHKPWEYSAEILEAVKDGRITENSLAAKLQESFKMAYSLTQLAEEKNITIKEPFQGEKIGVFTVLSPSKYDYLELITKSNKTPEIKESLLEKAGFYAKKVIQWIASQWDKDNLSEDVSTSEINETSVVLYGDIDDKRILLTGDSGIISLNSAADYAEAIDVDLKECCFIQIPHHGSRNNVSPSVLNRVIGDIVPKDSDMTKTAFVSAAKDDSDHPRHAVTNAFKRRGAQVATTEKNAIHSYYNTPSRPGWGPITPLPFYDEEEEVG
ncbi:MAG: MBL fold metallo-hydrolase [Clostridiaceae bacterium]|nr:MBL fold metallo-hydrolase [Clostridiaceae bacterium]